MDKRIRPCIKCSSTDITIWDCGYSSFNIGGAECKNCGNKVKCDPCGCFPRDEIIGEWNYENPTLQKEIKRIELEISGRKEEIRVYRKEITRLKKQLKG